jgi:TolB-like protein/Tfp pilus assembly protein PilF
LSYLGVGVADAITTRLANVRQIAVRPTWALLPHRDTQQEPTALASAIGVDYLLVGTVQPADGRYRVSVQLVRADGIVSWARSYDEAATSLLEMQDHIATEIVTTLRVRLSPPERERLHMRYTANPAAYDLYLRGRALLVAYTESNMREAIGYFEQAIALDPQYALAHAALATACAWFSVRYAYEDEARIWGKRADDEAGRALDQDAMLADAQLAIGSAAGTLYGGFNWAAVLDRSAAALSLDPSLDLAHVVRMRAFYHLGRFDEVRQEAELARRVNPTPNVEASRLEVAANLFGGRFSEAAAQATKLLAETDAPAVRHYLGMARYYLGDVQGARDMLSSARRGGKPDVRSQATLASIEAAVGRTREARDLARTIAAGGYMDHHVAYSLGATFAQLGDLAASMRWLQQAADTGFPCYPWFLQDSLLEPIRTQPDFLRLVQDLKRRPESPPRDWQHESEAKGAATPLRPR